MDLRKTRYKIQLTVSLLLFWIYLPAFVTYLLSKNKYYIDDDIQAYRTNLNISMLNNLIALLFLLHTNAYFRTIFYHRIGIIKSQLI